MNWPLSYMRSQIVHWRYCLQPEQHNHPLHPLSFDEGSVRYLEQAWREIFEIKEVQRMMKVLSDTNKTLNLFVVFRRQLLSLLVTFHDLRRHKEFVMNCKCQHSIQVVWTVQISKLLGGNNLGEIWNYITFVCNCLGGWPYDNMRSVTKTTKLLSLRFRFPSNLQVIILP